MTSSTYALTSVGSGGAMPFGTSDACNAAEDLIRPNLSAERRDRVAFIDGAGPHTFAEVAQGAAAFAGLLGELGVPREARVVLCLTDTVHFPICFLGALQYGAVPVPLNTRLIPGDYTWILADCRAQVLVVTDGLRPHLSQAQNNTPSLTHTLISGETEDGQDLDSRLARATPMEGFADTRRDEMAFWLYTSGTTGQPKGAVHAHGHLMATARLYARPTLSLTSEDVVFSAAKLYFAYGLGNALTFPMSVGATAVLLEGAPTPDAVSAILATHQPTLFFGVPTLFAMLLAHERLLPEAADTSLRLCVSAGEALPPDLLHRWQTRMGVEILDGLGSTEGLHIFLSNRQGAVRPGSSGLPVPGYDLRLIDEEGQPVEVGALGHLEVRGPTTALMYWNQRARSQATFRGAWMRTGDKYHQDEEGYFFYGGRSDDLMKVGGIWVSPFEVESALIAHEAVLECAVVARTDADGLVKPCAHVVLAEGIEPSDEMAELLIDAVRETLATWKRPRTVVFHDALPRTATGKVQRFKLRDEANKTT